MSIAMQNTTYEVLHVSETLILIRDLDQGRTITNDADAVVQNVSASLKGIGRRRLFYRDTDGRFDELVTSAEQFKGFRAGTKAQQVFFAYLVGSTMPASTDYQPEAQLA